MFCLLLYNCLWYNFPIILHRRLFRMDFDAKMTHGKAILEEQSRAPKCPICQPENLSKISKTKKIAKIAMFGIFGMGDNGKNWKCNDCNSKF